MVNALISQITEWIIGLFATSALNNAKSFFKSISELTGNIVEKVSEHPSMFSGSMWNFVVAVNNKVMLPVAGILLTYTAIYQLIEVVNEKNSFSDHELESIFKWIIKVMITILLVTNTTNIVDSAFKLSGTLTKQVAQKANTVGGDASLYDTNVKAVEELIDKHKEDKNISALLGMSAIFRLSNIILAIVKQLCQVVIYVRFFQIYIMASAGSIPMATFTSQRFQSMADNYLKNIFALGLQAVFMIIAITIYNIFLTDVVLKIVSPTECGLAALVSGGMLIMLLFKTEGIAKSLLNAS